MSAMALIPIDPSSPLDPFEQVRRDVIAQVLSGELAPGDRLPAIRALATELGLATGTVARAYKELEEAGVVLTRRGAGTRIAPEARSAASAAAPTAEAQLDPALRALLAAPIADALQAGHTPAQILAAARGELLGD